MSDNGHRLCSYTRGQIGWSDLFVELRTADEVWAGTDDDVWIDIGDHAFTLDNTDIDDRVLVDRVLKLLAQEKVDWTIFWRRLSHFMASGSVDPVRDLFIDRAGFDEWLLSFSERHAALPRDAAAALMLRTNPKFVLRNHLGQRAIEAHFKIVEFFRIFAAISR